MMHQIQLLSFLAETGEKSGSDWLHLRLFTARQNCIVVERLEVA
ncbi:MAG: hypothetical protein ACK56F_10125 [bacterium]